MTAITYGRTPTTTAPSKTMNLFERLLTALYESRVRAARREINRHLHLVPKDVLKQAGYTRGGDELPLA